MLPEKNLLEETHIKRQLHDLKQLPFTFLKKEMLQTVLSVLDLTSLEGIDNDDRVGRLCQQALSYRGHGLPDVAAVCVYPVFARLASTMLKGSGIRTACVAGAFPSGQSFLDIRLGEVQRAVAEGAEEIDMVISRGKYLEGNYSYIYDEVAKHKEACGSAHLKVILETGELPSLSDIYYASQIAISAGADFIKTSTGKVTPAATEEAFYVMLLAIKEHFEKTGIRIGIKPAGGISHADSAINYLHILIQTIGTDWATKEFFRIGASRLATQVSELLMKIS